MTNRGEERSLLIQLEQSRMDIEKLVKNIEVLGTVINPEQLEAEIEALQSQTEEPNFWNNPANQNIF